MHFGFRSISARSSGSAIWDRRGDIGMRDLTGDGTAAAHVTRILIVSYFVALAIGLVEGADLTRLVTPFLDEIPARHVSRLIVLTLCALVVFGLYRRAAALVLAIILFWTSYISLFSHGEVGGFWRDLALIGGLLMSARVGVHDRAADLNDTPSEAESNHSNSEWVAIKPRATVTRFREDLNLARID